MVALHALDLTTKVRRFDLAILIPPVAAVASNFASLLRTSCLIYLMGGTGKGAAPREFHIVAAE